MQVRDTDKVLFWDVDTQRDFCNEDGALYVPGAEDIKGNLARLSKLSAYHGKTLVKTGDWHSMSDEELVPSVEEADFSSTFPPHCMAGSPGAEFVPETTPMDRVAVIAPDEESELPDPLEYRVFRLNKTRFDVFEGNRQAVALLDLLDPDRVFVFGVSGNVCVMHAVDGLLEHSGASITVVEDAVASLPAEGGLSSWRELKQQWAKQGVSFADTSLVYELLR